jgi:hypothetical protein
MLFFLHEVHAWAIMTRMDENQLFQAALGIQPPWLVDRCTFDESASRLDIHLDFPRGSVFACPVCGVHCKAYDTDQLTWRHLNFFQHQTFLHARTPRVDCSQCGVHRVTVPWARPDSGFTLLFEALVLMLVKSMPVLATARLVNEHDTLIWRIVHHYLDSARARADHSAVTQVGIDETASRRGQKYVSLFVDLEQRRVLFATPGKDASTVAAFASDLKAHGGDPAAVTEVSADMSQAFFNGVTANLPEAAVTFDKFHVVSLVNNAVDKSAASKASPIPNSPAPAMSGLKTLRILLKNRRTSSTLSTWSAVILKPPALIRSASLSRICSPSPPIRPNITSTDGISGPPTAVSLKSLTLPGPSDATRPESSAGSLPASITESSKALTALSRLPKPKPAAIAPTATSPPSST